MPADYFSPSYKTTLYYLWYNKGKPTANTFLLEMPHDDEGKVPSKTTLHEWIKQWKIDCAEMDAKTIQELENKVVAEKVAMFERFAETGKEMQNIGLEWLQLNRNNLTPGTALRLVVEGVRIEEATSGVSDAIKKMLAMNDEDLANEIVERLTTGQIEILDADND